MADACICTRGPVVVHSGHCCFTDDGHGRICDTDEYKLGGPMPCGHTVTS